METTSKQVNDGIEEFVLDTEVEGFEINEELLSFLTQAYPDTVTRLTNVFQVFYSLNTIYHNQNKFYLEKLESRLLDLINTSSSIEEAKENIEIYIKRAIFNYLVRYGIQIHTEDMSVYDTIDFLEGYSFLYNIDIPSSQDLLDKISDDGIDAIERLTEAIDNYSILSESNIYNYIEEVNETFFTHMKEYLRAKVYRGIENVNLNDIDILSPLLKVNPLFTNTKIVSDSLYYGFKEFSLLENIDMLYSYINWYLEDTLGIAYEVAALNYLSSDKPITKDNITEIINFKSLDHIKYPESEDILVPKILEIINQIQGVK